MGCNASRYDTKLKRWRNCSTLYWSTLNIEIVPFNCNPRLCSSFPFHSIKIHVFVKNIRLQSPKSYFSTEVKVIVTMLLTFVSLGRASLVDYACQYKVSISYGSKEIMKVKVDNRQTNRQDKKQYTPDHLIRGIIKILINGVLNTFFSGMEVIYLIL